MKKYIAKVAIGLTLVALLSGGTALALGPTINPAKEHYEYYQIWHNETNPAIIQTLQTGNAFVYDNSEIVNIIEGKDISLKFTADTVTLIYQGTQDTRQYEFLGIDENNNGAKFFQYSSGIKLIALDAHARPISIYDTANRAGFMIWVTMDGEKGQAITFFTVN